MKRILLITLLTVALTGCTKNKTQITKMKIEDERFREIEEFLKSNNNIDSGLIIGRDEYILVYCNPNMKVKNIGVDTKNGHFKVNIDCDNSKDEPMSFYNIDLMKSKDKFREDGKIILEENGVEINPIIFDGENIIKEFDISAKK